MSLTAITIAGQFSGSGTLGPYTGAVGRSTLDKLSETLSVKDFGAKGDWNGTTVTDANATDNTVAIQRAINSAAITGYALFLPPGIHMVTGPLTMVSFVRIYGPGTIRASQLSFPGGTRRAMIEFDGGIHNASLDGITLDMAGTGRSGTKLVNYHVLMGNCRSNVLKEVTFKDAGYGSLPADLPDGPSILMVTHESTGDYGGTHGGSVGGPTDNLIVDCRFEASSTFQFGIRLLTSWIDGYARNTTGTPRYETRGNIIRGCKFYGSGNYSFGYNTIEMAGPNTCHNVVEECYFNGYAITHVDMDKRVHHNKVINNTVDWIKKPAAWLTDDILATRLAAFTDHTDDLAFPNEGNLIQGNTVNRIEFDAADEDVLPTAIYLYGTLHAKVLDNDVTGSTGASTLGNGISLDSDNVHATVSRNNVVGFKIGIRTTSVGSRESLDISFNQIETAGNVSCGIYIGGTTPASGDGPKGVKIVGNDIVYNGTGSAGIFLNTEISAPLLEANYVIGPNAGIAYQTFATDTMFVGNYARDATTGFHCDATTQTLIGNTAYGCSNDFLRGDPANVVRLLGNRFANQAGGEISYGTAAPTGGTWVTSAIVFNSTPAAGSPLGWVCTSGGTPGTWVSFGVVLAKAGATTDLKDLLVSAGLLTDSGATPLNLDGGTMTAGSYVGIQAANVPSLPASQIGSGQIALARGGTNADLSATGGSGQYLQQASVGGAVTVGAIPAADVPSLAASKITSGQVGLARGGTNADLSATGGATSVLQQTTVGGAITSTALTAGQIPSLAASKITSGQLATAQGGTGLDMSALGGSNQVVKMVSAGVFSTATITDADIDAAAHVVHTNALNQAIAATGTAGTGATDYGLKITATYNQTDTAAATDLFINRTNTAAGSGTHLLADMQVGGSTKAKISTDGTITLNNALSSAGIFVNNTNSSANAGLFFQRSGTTKWQILLNATNNNFIIFDQANSVNAMLVTASTGGLSLGSSAKAIGFFGGAGATKQTLSGSRGSATATVLGSLVTMLANSGYLTDSTTA